MSNFTGDPSDLIGKYLLSNRPMFQEDNRTILYPYQTNYRTHTFPGGYDTWNVNSGPFNVFCLLKVKRKL